MLKFFKAAVKGAETAVSAGKSDVADRIVRGSKQMGGKVNPMLIHQVCEGSGQTAVDETGQIQAAVA